MIQNVLTNLNPFNNQQGGQSDENNQNQNPIQVAVSQISQSIGNLNPFNRPNGTNNPVNVIQSATSQIQQVAGGQQAGAAQPATAEVQGDQPVKDQQGPAVTITNQAAAGSLLVVTQQSNQPVASEQTTNQQPVKEESADAASGKIQTEVKPEPSQHRQRRATSKKDQVKPMKKIQKEHKKPVSASKEEIMSVVE